MDKESDSDELYEEQDQQFEQSKLERSFVSLCSQGKQQIEQMKGQFVKQVPRSIQMMFILFSFYRNDITSIGLEWDCKAKISLNKIKISSEVSEKNVDKCYEKIVHYLQAMVYTLLNHQNKFKVIYSPYFNLKAEQLGFKICKFNQQIYCHTRKMQQKQLKRVMKDLFSGQNIFSVVIKLRKVKEKQIYEHLRAFIKKMKQHYAKQSTQRQVIVELDYLQNTINCIGTQQRNLMAIKNKFKNLLQSTVILIVKMPSQQGIDKKVEKLKLYLGENASFPIHIAKLQKRIITIISKQNVIRKILGRQKIIDIIGINDKTEIGMFVPKKYNYHDRKLMIEGICRKKGYDFTTLGGVYHYFKKMFTQQDEQNDPKQVLALIIEILQEIQENKQRFQIPVHIKAIKKNDKNIEVTQGEYYSIGEISLDQYLSKVLKRDVMRQKLRMSKNVLVKYKVCDAQESAVLCWYLDKDNNKIKCEITDMKPGVEYFCGKTKKLGNEVHYFIEAKLKVI